MIQLIVIQNILLLKEDNKHVIFQWKHQKLEIVETSFYIIVEQFFKNEQLQVSKAEWSHIN